jgi:hypothetical protein
VENHRVFTNALWQQAHVQSVLVVQRNDKLTSFLSGCCYLVVVNRPDVESTIRQIVIDGELIVEQRFSTWQLEKWAVHGLDESLVPLFYHADIIFDKDDYIKGVLPRLLRMPPLLQKQRVCVEYSVLLRRFQEAKDFLSQGLAIDAYQSLMLALQAWARLLVCEAGEQPEPAIWLQVKKMDASVYKLYEELSASSETMEKRIELLLLPIEFCLTSKLKECAQYVLDVMQTRNRPWLLQELLMHPLLAESGIEISLLLEKLVHRSIILEILVPSIEGVHEKAYLLSG